MTLATTNVRVEAAAARAMAISLHLNLLFNERERPLQPGGQDHIRTGIGEQDARHRTGSA